MSQKALHIYRKVLAYIGLATIAYGIYWTLAHVTGYILGSALLASVFTSVFCLTY